MRKFKPGMVCPGTGGRACGVILETRQDCHPETLKCPPCGTEEQSEYQRANRAANLHKCADCPKLCGARAERCRKCAFALGRKRKLEKRQVVVVPEVVAAPRNDGAAWPGLRGPGGEWEHGVTSVQGWATLDGGRV